MDNIKFPSTDKYPLAASLFRAETQKGTLVIHSATAVPRQFYARFAEYAASRGWTTLTFDYRGIGDSRPRNLRGFRASMTDWARLDTEAAHRWILKNSPGGKHAVVAHSFGGQAMALMSDNAKLDRVVMLGAQSGYWKNFPKRKWLPFIFLWYVGMPLLTRLLGYFPAKFLRLGEDLPREAALEWSHWNRSPKYIMTDFKSEADNRFLDFKCPVMIYEISDDSYAPSKAVRELAKSVPSVLLRMRPIQPSDIGVKQIGHFGPFRPSFQNTIWKEIVDFLDQTTH